MSDSGLVRLRAAILASERHQAMLAAYEDRYEFARHALSLAVALDIPVEASELAGAVQPDPVGIGRWADVALTEAVPQRGWLPVGLVPGTTSLQVDWVHFGDQPLREPFFEDSVRIAMRRPINLFARHRTTLAGLRSAVLANASAPPAGFVFHMSRCGSTLAAQMFASDPQTIAVSEAQPLDQVLQLAARNPAAAPMLVRDMVAALCQIRDDRSTRAVIKLDSWHTLALPLFRQVFPEVPWVFLYREPVEVLASQLYQRGIQTVPEYLSPELFGLSRDDALEPEDYCARVLGRTCEAALQFPEGGLVVNYRELPDAVFSRIAPHFGIDVTQEMRAAMTDVAAQDAKRPSIPFDPQQPEKRKLMTAELRAIATRRLAPVYRELEARNTASAI
ncbi:MAG: aspartyl beta-hydroxylase [Proteobacteria bacterium]|nr:aspartyl beta-hydroxylase [Pseudomonadota bacterium]